jgi:uncharacterized protein (UPF0332 family)
MIIDFKKLIEDDEEIKSFRTYKNYLLSLQQFLNKEYGEHTGIFKKLSIACEQSDSFAKIQANKKADIRKVKKLLFNAWHTEVVFSMPRIVNGDLIKYANHWAPIQAYYSVFLALRALFESIGIDCPPNHTHTLQQVSEFVVKRNLFPCPFNSFHKGLNELKNAHYGNFQNNTKQISNLSTPQVEDFWNWYALWFKTTRDRKFLRRKKEILKNKRFRTSKGKPRKNLSLRQKVIVEEGLHATTIFDVLYRLRIRSNYEDADAFILGVMSSEEALSFHNSLVVILESLLFAIERCISKYLSRKSFLPIANDFMGSVGKRFNAKTIGSRINNF